MLICTVAIMGSLLCSSAHGAAVQAGKKNKLSPLFQSLEPLTLSISAPFSTIDNHRDEERPYFPATMTLKDNDGKETLLNLKIKVRGNYRTKKKICFYPPLKFNFIKKSLVNTVFDGENNLKLVTQCKGSKSYKDYLLLEYMVYRVYQLFTDNSLRVRLANIHYYDSDKEQDLGTRMAFFIEDITRMAKRTGMKEHKAQRIKPGEYDPALLNLVDIFEYFIGNTDWSAIVGTIKEGCCHNIIPMRSEAGPLVPVPYDFDITGAVNPPYAVVNEKLPIKSVRNRFYRGICTNENILRNTLAIFVNNREKIRALYENQPELAARVKKSALDYYDDFYTTVQNDKKLKYAILNRCR